MKKSVSLLFVIFIAFTFGCEDSLETEGLPLCIQTIIEKDRDSEYPIQKVSEQIVDNESFYLLENNFVTVGESTNILNNQCDVICFYCSDCILPECSSNYPREEWKIIWEK